MSAISSSLCFHPPTNTASSLPRRPTTLQLTTTPQRFSKSRWSHGMRCRSSNEDNKITGGNESLNVLDAFFLGKALAEALNERVESTVGEFISVVGQWQAEQQKQVQEFQEEVVEKAKRAKEKAALEALEKQGGISESANMPSKTTSTTYGFMAGDPLQEMFKD